MLKKLNNTVIHRQLFNLFELTQFTAHAIASSFYLKQRQVKINASTCSESICINGQYPCALMTINARSSSVSLSP